MPDSVRAVYDCNIYFQALISPRGPAARCLEVAANGTVDLWQADFVFDELVAVCQRPRLVRRYKLTPQRVGHFVTLARSVGRSPTAVPRRFELPRDPEDARYIDLCLAVAAGRLVTRDRDLLDLAAGFGDEADRLAELDPNLRVVEPPVFLAEVAL